MTKKEYPEFETLDMMFSGDFRKLLNIIDPLFEIPLYSPTDKIHVDRLEQEYNKLLERLRRT